MMALDLSGFDSSLLLAAESRLAPTFGLAELRPWQRDAMRALLEGSERVLVVAPTGGGKSLTYQLPAVVLPRVTIVLSPLVALMEDQVHALEEKGIAATYIASTLPLPERRAREDGFARGAYKIVYAAPERLANSQFVDRVRRAAPSLIAVDEAHCISQWGHDFRPDYLRVGQLLATLNPERVLACTATATPDVRREIVRHLGFEGAPHDVVLRGFARPNLHLAACAVDGPRDVQQRTRAALLRALGAGPPKRRGDRLLRDAKKSGGPRGEAQRAALARRVYHAGLSAESARACRTRSRAKELDVVVATNAFGMGIDRADMRAVVHAQPPSSIEAYYQEVGRAGRDGARRTASSCAAAPTSRCGDGSSKWERAASARRATRSRARGSSFASCSRTSTRGPAVTTSCCDISATRASCSAAAATATCARVEAALDDEDEGARDATKVVVQKALSGVARANRRAGIAAVASMLVGTDDERTRRFGFTRLSTFGLFKGDRVEWVTALLRALLAAGWIDLTPTEHPVPFVTKTGWDAMRGARARSHGAPIARTSGDAESTQTESARATRCPTRSRTTSSSCASAITAPTIARARQVPAYVVAHDRTLVELVKKKPRTLGDLDGVHGFGPSRIEQYGAGFLAVINQ